MDPVYLFEDHESPVEKISECEQDQLIGDIAL